MREIKFRGLSVGDKKWVYGVPVYFPDKDKVCILSIVKRDQTLWTLVEKDSIGEYTGLKDKNGVEIYEGDICNVKNKNTNPHEVRFHDSCFMFSYTEMKYYSEFEVIGNIYENPELLEKSS